MYAKMHSVQDSISKKFEKSREAIKKRCETNELSDAVFKTDLSKRRRQNSKVSSKILINHKMSAGGVVRSAQTHRGPETNRLTKVNLKNKENFSTQVQPGTAKAATTNEKRNQLLSSFLTTKKTTVLPSAF